MHGGGILLDFAGDASLEAVARAYGGQIQYIAAQAKDQLELSALLIRPDGLWFGLLTATRMLVHSTRQQRIGLLAIKGIKRKKVGTALAQSTLSHQQIYSRLQLLQGITGKP
jgi:hypothetical protein